MRVIHRTCLAAVGALLLATAAAPQAPPAPGLYDRLIDAAKSEMMQDPDKARRLAHEASAAAATGTTPAARALAVARARWLEGEALSRLDRQGEALTVLDQALAPVVRLAPSDPLRGDLLLSRGWVREARGGIAEGLADFQQAFEIYREAGEMRGQAKALQNIAGIYQDAGDNEHAQRFYALATEIYHGDPAFALAAYNNVGESLRLLGRYAAAERQFDLALKAARTAGSPLLQANVLTNLASTRLLRGDIQGATRLAEAALALTAHREAADERPFAYGVMAQIAAAQHDDAHAAAMIGRTFQDVDLATSSIQYRDFHKLAADIYTRQNRPALALAHMRAWKRLDDGVRAVAASTNAALMAARFDFSTQNLRIVQLQANRAKLHETVLIIVVSAVSLISALLLAGLLSLRRSRNRVRAANRDLTVALKAKSDFMAMTSHEIRTPLNGILGMTQVILADQQLPAPMRRQVEVAHRAGETMRALVDDILDLSKMESGKLAVTRGPVRLKLLIDEAASLWRSQAEAKGLTFAIDLSQCPADIEEDGDRLRQILFNLLSNAVKFTDAGLVKLTATAHDTRLVISAADTGIGIAAEHHALIFEKFQQADASTTRRFGGTGLGLAICRNLAEAMDGSISVDSRLGEGATFTLSLPLRRIEPIDTPEPAAAAASAIAILLEPNALTRRVLAKTIEAHCAQVAAVATADEVLEAFSAGSVASAVLHYAAVADRLPEIIAAAHGHAAQVILLCAADETPSETDRHKNVTILHKPFTASILADALRTGAAGWEEVQAAA